MGFIVSMQLVLSSVRSSTTHLLVGASKNASTAWTDINPYDGPYDFVSALKKGTSTRTGHGTRAPG